MRRAAALVLGSLSIVDAKVFFSESFGDGWENRWTLSKWKENEKDSKEKMGKWRTATGKYFRDEVEDRGIQTSEIMKFYSIAAPFDSFSNEDKDLIVQYQAKYEKDLSCGGGYLKVGPKQDDLTAFGDPTPYNIMFGPDQCNTNKKTQLIFSYKGKNFLKKSDLPFKQEGEGVSHLYRLVLKANGTVRVEVDREKLYEGALKDDWDMLPQRQIADPEDKKPKDWVEDAMVDDPETKKPADWVDEKKIKDATASKPQDWDEEEDGEWEAPHVDNPAFKGEWKAKRISNPAYKGLWTAKMVANPDFVDDPALGRYGDFGYVGFDVYQVKGGTIFDNVIITDTEAEADEFAQKWVLLSEAEKSKKTVADSASDEAFEKFRKARAAKAAAEEAANPKKKDEEKDDTSKGKKKDKKRKTEDKKAAETEGKPKESEPSKKSDEL